MRKQRLVTERSNVCPDGYKTAEFDKDYVVLIHNELGIFRKGKTVSMVVIKSGVKYAVELGSLLEDYIFVGEF